MGCYRSGVERRPVVSLAFAPFVRSRREAMAMKIRLGTLAVVACMTLAAVSGVARADEVPLITGEHWTKSSEALKKVYLIGIANVAQVETAYNAANPPPDAQSIVPRMVKGMKGQTLDGVR